MEPEEGVAGSGVRSIALSRSLRGIGRRLVAALRGNSVRGTLDLTRGWFLFFRGNLSFVIGMMLAINKFTLPLFY